MDMFGDTSEEPNGDGPPSDKAILLGGEDAMEVDENVALPDMSSEEAAQRASLLENNELPQRIITPSPYPHHMTGATAARFRNAMSRVTTDPTSDVEAWQAIITEANTCWRNLVLQQNVHAVDADTHAKLDWMESCYAALLHNFPYASAYYVTLVEMLLAQSARVGEQEGPLTDYGRDPPQRTLLCEKKVEKIFRRVLGVEMDGSPASTDTKVIGGMCTSSTELWLLYIRKRIRDAHRQARATLSNPEEQEDLVRTWSTEAYETALKYASFVHNNHLLWKQYLQFVKGWVPPSGLPASQQPNHALQQKQMIQLRSVYQRLVTHPMTGLDQLWQEYEAFERIQSEALAAALIAEFAPHYQHARSTYLERNRIYSNEDLQMGRLATPPADTSDEEYSTKLREELSLLTLWKKRCAYERTNPERRTSSELVQRIRQAYKDMACTLTRHPEVWHMWSMWEQSKGGDDAKDKTSFAVAVLELGQTCIPDCTLLSYAQAQLLELHTKAPSECIDVMMRFVERSPNTLGFILLQQMVRRYKGMAAARAIFAKARRVLVASEKDAQPSESQDPTAAATEGTEKETDEQGTAAAKDVDKADNGHGRMVTNRLDPEIASEGSKLKTSAESDAQTDAKDVDETQQQQQGDSKAQKGVITWQLYASHAAMEHRLNRAPNVAARVYELGLRKHSSFLAKPPYVLRYAQLLLELHDTENLRALLSRSIAASESFDGKDNASAAADLWDMSVRFEAILSGTDATNLSALDSVERKRRAALVGADVEDVATGGLGGAGDGAVVGSTKSTISEQLVRSEGYDTSSNIVNGMGRAMEVLEITGVWGTPNGSLLKRRSANIPADDSDGLVGGKSDASYQRRLRVQTMSDAGVSADVALGTDSAGTKGLSARERLQQTTAPTMQTSAAALLIQQSPEWLRPMLLLLPASRFRSAAMNKPPPHMIEMALSALRSNALPAERPKDGGRGTGDPRKRKMNAGDSSDEEGDFGSGGYGNQFRSRQRARQMGSTSADGSADIQ